MFALRPNYDRIKSLCFTGCVFELYHHSSCEDSRSHSDYVGSVLCSNSTNCVIMIHLGLVGIYS